MSDVVKPPIHGRDHRPGGSDPIPNLNSFESALAYDSTASGGTATVSNATLTTVSFEQFSVSTGSTAFTQGSGTTAFTLKKAGWYLFYLNFEWSGGGFTDSRLYELVMNSTADNDGASMTTTDGIGVEANSPIQAGIHHTWGPLYFRGTVTVKLKVQHSAGSSQTVTGVLLTGVYMGTDTDPGRFPPF